MISRTSGGTASRGFKKEARHKAENGVDLYVKNREQELKQLSCHDVSVVFLTMSGMFWLAHSCEECMFDNIQT